MKTSRFRHSYRQNASKLHKVVGEILRNNNIFSGFTAYQEYPVDRVNQCYPHSSHHFDWVIPAIRIVFECHGKQHYEPVAFDGDDEKAIDSFRAIKSRDQDKKIAALDANYTYVVIPYWKEKSVGEQDLWDMFQLGLTELSQYTKQGDFRYAKRSSKDELAEEISEKRKEARKAARQHYLSSDQHMEQLGRAREYRKQRYRRLKEFKDEIQQ